MPNEEARIPQNCGAQGDDLWLIAKRESRRVVTRLRQPSLVAITAPPRAPRRLLAALACRLMTIDS
jgi:hypothetical protein